MGKNWADLPDGEGLRNKRTTRQERREGDGSKARALDSIQPAVRGRFVVEGIRGVED